jgi:hypothetical protein
VGHVTGTKTLARGDAVPLRLPCGLLLECSLNQLARSSIGWRIPLFQGGEEGSTPSRAITQAGRGQAW